MRVVVTALVLVLSISIGYGAGEVSPQATETTIDLKLIQALLETHIELSDEQMAPPEEPITIREFSRRLSKEIARRMIRRDAWGNEFMVVGDQQEFCVVSAGVDQVHDAIRFLKNDELPLNGQWIKDTWGDDIVLVLGEGIVNGAASVRNRQKRSMADLRSIGTSIESFSIDNNVYPRQDRDLLPVELIRDSLSPVYIRTLPLIDAWGNEFLMWGTEGEYVIMSLGADGVPDQYYGFAQRDTESFPFNGAFADPNNDIIFANGQFVQWPEGKQH